MSERGEGPDLGPGVAQVLGAEPVEVGAGRARVRYRARPEWRIPSNRVQGGFVAAMIDHAMAAAVHSVLDPGEFHTTIELKVNYFRGAPVETLTAEAAVLRRGRRTAYVEATLYDGAGEMVARATSTFMILPRTELVPGEG
ncbi:MAG TPA: PaaI family thioesterase [Dehalococcoidia bacterium]